MKDLSFVVGTTKLRFLVLWLLHSGRLEIITTESNNSEVVHLN